MTDPLPYGPVLSRVLEPIRRGFLVVNRRVTAPALRSGLGVLLGTPATGSMLVLRTRGRRSGLVREAPLGYAVHDGRVVVVAGYGRTCSWFVNALADPQVEVLLPGARLAGTAAELTDPGERDAAFVTAITAMGVVGRATVGDLTTASPERVRELATAFPVLAVTPTAVLPGPFDPGGPGARRGAAVGAALTVAAVLGVVAGAAQIGALARATRSSKACA